MKISRYTWLGAILSATLLTVSSVHAIPPWYDDTNTDTLASLDCAAGQVVLYDGAEWICSDIVNEMNQLIQNQQTTINEQQTIIEEQASILQYFSLEEIYDGSTGYYYPAVRLTAANFQVVNGSNSDTPNGTGNLIVGYNPYDLDQARYTCSDGSYEDREDCENFGHIWSNEHRSGSHNIVVGWGNNYSTSGGLLAGISNTVNGYYVSVLGGNDNVASAQGSSISGGQKNTTTGELSSILGGWWQTASGRNSTISGGFYNKATAEYSSVSGGSANDANGYASSVSGGLNRDVTDEYNWRAGELTQDR